MPPLRYYDAHCHWQDARLSAHNAQIMRDLNSAGVARAVINSTGPEDWSTVAALAAADPRVLPAFGVHPWRVGNGTTAGDSPPIYSNQQPPAPLYTPAPLHTLDWLQTLEACLAAFPQAGVGEIGLDNWITGADKTRQRDVFLAQLALAARDNRPVSIHCLRAEADLLAALKQAPALPVRGIHLHGFSGSLQSAFQLLDLGAYFSFSEYIAEPKRARARAIAVKIPLERLLAETDAPDMQGPPQWQHYRLEGSAPFAHAPQGLPPKHPANIVASYRCLAQLRQLDIEALANAIEANFLRYFIV